MNASTATVTTSAPTTTPATTVRPSRWKPGLLAAPPEGNQIAGVDLVRVLRSSAPDAVDVRTIRRRRASRVYGAVSEALDRLWPSALMPAER
jgi:hypothetical protein